MKLGVNIDHVATLRQARYKGITDSVPEPDPIWAGPRRRTRRHLQHHDPPSRRPSPY